MEFNKEFEELKSECDSLLERWKEADAALAKKVVEIETSHQVIDKLQSKIKFLEGQIDAYQYCMNCRR